VEDVEPRAWWRLEPSADDEAAPSPFDSSYAEYSRTHYRDRAAIDSLMWTRVEAGTPRQASGPDPEGPGHYDPYGSPVGPEAGEAVSWVAWANACRRRAHVTPGPYRDWFLSTATAGLLDRFSDDESLAKAIPPSPSGEIPPGSVVGLRHRGLTSFFESVSNLVDRSNTLDHQIWAVGAGMAVYDAPMFWLPEGVGAECLTSEQPDPELVERIRLPFDSVLVGLARPVPAAALGDVDEETWRTAMAADGTRDALRGEPHLAAVWMAAGDDGWGIDPVVMWFVETGGGISAVPGIWTHSAYSGAVANLGAVLTWETWYETPGASEDIGAPGSKDRRKALKKNSVRKSIARGALHKVRVLVIPTPAAGSATTDVEVDGPGRRSPIRHWRRGHWTKVRKATRDAAGAIVGATSGTKDVDWHYEGHWIRPALVNPKGAADPGVKVYKQVAKGA
jgi:hypothetical protein